MPIPHTRGSRPGDFKSLSWVAHNLMGMTFDQTLEPVFVACNLALSQYLISIHPSKLSSRASIQRSPSLFILASVPHPCSLTVPCMLFCFVLICLCIPTSCVVLGRMDSQRGEAWGRGKGEARRGRGLEKKIYGYLILLNMKEVELRGKRTRRLSVWSSRSKPHSCATY